MTVAADRVVVFGEALVDLFPEERGRALRDVERFVRHLGGAPANVAVGLARLGIPTALVTRVGADELGAFVLGALDREGIDVSSVGTSPARTGLTLVSVGADGERSFLFYRHPSADQCVEPGDLTRERLVGARFLHFGSSTLCREPARAATLQAVRWARQAGVRVSMDANLRPHLWGDRASMDRLVREVLCEVDLVKVNEEELAAIGGAGDVGAVLEKLLGQGPSVAVVTLAERGCAYSARHGPAGVQFVATTAVECVDATGAGDGFVAGMLASLVESPEDLPRAMRWGNAVGARVVGAVGATTALPGREDLLRLYPALGR